MATIGVALPKTQAGTTRLITQNLMQPQLHSWQAIIIIGPLITCCPSVWSKTFNKSNRHTKKGRCLRAPSFFIPHPTLPLFNFNSLSSLHTTNRHPNATRPIAVPYSPIPTPLLVLPSPHIYQIPIIYVKTKSVIRKPKLRSNCRIVQRTGISPTPYPCSAYLPCAVERQRFPLATERGRSILHRYSIVIASLLEMITENKPGSRQHRAEIERPKWG